MASSSSSSSARKDLLIYIFYFDDIRGKESNLLFPQIDGAKFITKVKNFKLISSTKKWRNVAGSTYEAKTSNLTEVNFRLWVGAESSFSVIHREDKDVHVFYITSSFISNYAAGKNRELFSMFDTSKYDKTFIYPVRFMDNIHDFESVENFRELKNNLDITQHREGDVNLFNLEYNKIFSHFFLNGFFRKSDDDAMSSSRTFYSFLDRIGFTNTVDDKMSPAFMYRSPDSINPRIVNATIINKYTPFLFLDFNAYMRYIYDDYVFKTNNPQPPSEIIANDHYKIWNNSELIRYESAIIDEMVEKLRRAESRVGVLEGELGTFNVEISEKTRRIQQENLNRAREEIYRLRSDLERRTEDQPSSSTTNPGAVRPIAEIHMLNEKIKALKEKIRELKTENERLANENIKVRTRLAETHAELTGVRTELGDTSAKLGTTREKLSNVREELDDTRAKLSEGIDIGNKHVDLAAAAIDEARDMTRKVIELERKVDRRNAIINDLRQQLSSTGQLSAFDATVYNPEETISPPISPIHPSSSESYTTSTPPRRRLTPTFVSLVPGEETLYPTESLIQELNPSYIDISSGPESSSSFMQGKLFDVESSSEASEDTYVTRADLPPGSPLPTTSTLDIELRHDYDESPVPTPPQPPPALISFAAETSEEERGEDEDVYVTQEESALLGQEIYEAMNVPSTSTSEPVFIIGERFMSPSERSNTYLTHRLERIRGISIKGLHETTRITTANSLNEASLMFAPDFMLSATPVTISSANVHIFSATNSVVQNAVRRLQEYTSRENKITNLL